MECKHGVTINRRLKIKCRTDCSLEDFKECRTIWRCKYNTTGLYCLFCNVEYYTACWEKHDAFEKMLVNLAFGC